ncbi:MAG: hypothetical protein QG567_2185 [Campylobacterota bacterium]|nr:hypothetical protein [Campylobacterota bacterium]
MNKVLTFIVAKDENKQNIIMDIEVGDNLTPSVINIAGKVVPKSSLGDTPIIISRELFQAMSNNKPMDLTSKYRGLSRAEVLKQVENKIKDGII